MRIARVGGLISAALGIALLGGCDQPLGAGDTQAIPLPVANAKPLPPGVAQGCSDVLQPSRVAGSQTDARRAWLIDLTSGERIEIGWPPGYSARFAPDLTVIDDHGVAVTRAGDVVFGTCDVGDPVAKLMEAPFPGYRMSCGPFDVIDCALTAQRVATQAGWPARDLAEVSLLDRRGTYRVLYASGEVIEGTIQPL